jgi:poly(A) polymerase
MGAHQPVAPSLSDEELLRLLKQAAADLKAQAWVVGGYVRDKLLDRPHPNPDVVVERGDALKLAERFAELAGADPPVMFERFGTAQVTLPGHLVEFVNARAESYAPDSRKPDVRPATLDEDLRRRDFTINTLLMDLDGNLHASSGRLPTRSEPLRMIHSACCAPSASRPSSGSSRRRTCFPRCGR